MARCRLGPNHDNVRPRHEPVMTTTGTLCHAVSPPHQASLIRANNEDCQGANMKAFYLILSVIGNFHMGKRKGSSKDPTIIKAVYN